MHIHRRDMLTKSQIQYIAKKQDKPAAMIEKDYALEWLLYGVYHADSQIRDHLIFKGGTAIKKIFFPTKWRFSEDLDFTLLPNTDPDFIKSGLNEIYKILEKESGIIFEEDQIIVTPSGKAIFGHVQFTGPLGMKNRIKMDMSRTEKMADLPSRKTATTAYGDLANFPVIVYSLDEVLSEKIRSMMQRTKVRDYYDVWKLFQLERKINVNKIADMVKTKCQMNDIKYNPEKIFEQEKLDKMMVYWNRDLPRLAIEELPDLKDVFSEIKNLLSFLHDK